MGQVTSLVQDACTVFINRLCNCRRTETVSHFLRLSLELFLYANENFLIKYYKRKI